MPNFLAAASMIWKKFGGTTPSNAEAVRPGVNSTPNPRSHPQATSRSCQGHRPTCRTPPQSVPHTTCRTCGVSVQLAFLGAHPIQHAACSSISIVVLMLISFSYSADAETNVEMLIFELVSHMNWVQSRDHAATRSGTGSPCAPLTPTRSGQRIAGEGQRLRRRCAGNDTHVVEVPLVPHGPQRGDHLLRPSISGADVLRFMRHVATAHCYGAIAAGDSSPSLNARGAYTPLRRRRHAGSDRMCFYIVRDGYAFRNQVGTRFRQSSSHAPHSAPSGNRSCRDCLMLISP